MVLFKFLSFNNIVYFVLLILRHAVDTARGIQTYDAWRFDLAGKELTVGETTPFQCLVYGKKRFLNL